MKLLKNTINGYRYLHRTLRVTIAYFIKGVARELHIAPKFFSRWHGNVALKNMKRKYLIYDDLSKKKYFDIKGAKMAYEPTCLREMRLLAVTVFEDTFLFPVFHEDNYDREIVEKLDPKIGEGPYGYKDGNFDVTVKKGDVVVDAGAWIGDFSAYAVSKGAVAYAFEPVQQTFEYLCKTAEINDGKIYPIKKGLSNREGELDIFFSDHNSGANSFVMQGNGTCEKTAITTLDQFVKENHIEKIDFIKADIEGAERDMLRGATNVLKNFAPKLAICTYHLPDDPQVLEKIILEANPNYKIVHLSHKLFAAVENKGSQV